MQQFLKKILFFIIPIVLVTLTFEIYLRTLNTDYKQKNKGLIENYNNINILILGNSHGYNGINPSKFDLPAYNMAAGGQSLYFDKRITLKHIDKLKQLKYVLISVDYHSFYFSSQGIRDTWLYYDYGIKYKDKKEILSSLSYFWFGYTPRIAISEIKNRILHSSENERTISGWMPAHGTNENQFTEKSLKYKGNWFNKEVRNSNEREEIITDLDDFIVKLKEHNITPIFYTLPMYEGIYKYLDDDYLLQNEKDIEYLISKHNIFYWDLSKFSSQDKSLFLNQDHLNKKGADKLTKELNALLIANFMKN